MANPTTVSWLDPTQNTDGSAITAGEITGYLVGVRLVSGSAGTYPYTAIAPATATSLPLSALSPQLPAGQFVAAAQASTSVGNSDWSAESPAFTILATPKPPTSVQVS